MNKHMCIIVVLLVIFMQSCVLGKITQSSEAPALPSVNAVWSGSRHSAPPLKYYLGETVSRETLDCNITYSIDGDLYVFQVTTDKDTATITISRYYVGTDVDSVNVMINPGIDTSSVSVIHNCSWILQGRWFCRGSRPMSDFCHVSSTKPIHVAVFVLTDWQKHNVNKTIYEFLQEEQVRRLDAIIQSMSEKY